MLSKGFFKYIDIACSECTGKLHSMFKSSILHPLDIKFHYPHGR